MTSSFRGRALLGLRPPGRRHIEALVTHHWVCVSCLEEKTKTVRNKSQVLFGGFPRLLKAEIHQEALFTISGLIYSSSMIFFRFALRIYVGSRRECIKNIHTNLKPSFSGNSSLLILSSTFQPKYFIHF